MKRYLLFVVWVCLCGNIWAQLLQDRIADYVCSSSLLKTSEVGVAVYDLTSDTLIYGYQDKKLYRPASIEKIITSVTALAQLGIDYTFATRVAYTGTILADSTLQGDLYVIGGFDSEFTEQDMKSFARQIHAAGINKIEGHLVGDVSMMDDVYWGTGWAWDDTPESFQPYLSPLMLNRGCVNVVVSPSQAKAAPKVTVSPASDYYAIENKAVSYCTDAGNLCITRDWLNHSNVITISGNVSKRASKLLNMYSSKDFFMSTFRFVLQEEGISVSSFSFGECPSHAQNICSLDRSLIPILERALKKSDNLAAESIFYHLGMIGSDSLHIGFKDAQNAVYRFMNEEIGYDSDNYKIVDGSGVSMYNYISPDLLLAYLKYIYGRPDLFKVFYNALPIAGIDGTLSGRMKKGLACKNVHAKTGTVTGVCSLAGYVKTKKGKMLAFVIINQNILNGKSARKFQDALCEILAQ